MILIARESLRDLDGKRFMRRHIERTGETIAGAPVWTQSEITALWAAFPDREGTCSVLRRRTWAAIRQNARHLGLSRAQRIWTHDDARLLRSLYPTGLPIDELIHHFAGKTKRQIWRKAAHLRVRRRTPGALRAGEIPFDRARAYPAHPVVMMQADGSPATADDFDRILSQPPMIDGTSATEIGKQSEESGPNLERNWDRGPDRGLSGRRAAARRELPWRHTGPLSAR